MSMDRAKGLPRLDFTGEVYTVTMMELRQEPGEVIDRVSRGATVKVTKAGKLVAVIKPPASEKPLTFGLNLGGEYANIGRVSLVHSRP